MAGLKKSNDKKDLADVFSTEEEVYRNLDIDTEVGEDGCVHDVPMLAGYVDEDGTLHNTFSYREMTGRDEEAIKKGDVASNGAKVANVVVERCVTQIGTLTKKELGTLKWGKLIRSLLGGDIDYMAFKIREFSKGKEIKYSYKCPECGAKLDVVVETTEFGIKPFQGQVSIPFSLHRGYRDSKGVIHTEGSIHLPTGLDREVVFPYFKKNMSTATSLLLSRCITFDDGAVVTQKNVTDMSLIDRQILEDLLKDGNFGLDTNVDVYCSTCGADLSGEVGNSNFF